MVEHLVTVISEALLSTDSQVEIGVSFAGRGGDVSSTALLRTSSQNDAAPQSIRASVIVVGATCSRWARKYDIQCP